MYLTIAKEQYGHKEFSGCYNVGPDDADCVKTGFLVELFCEKWGEGLTWRSQNDGGPHEANFLKLDCSKVKQVFGWYPRYHVEDAVEKTVEWSKAWLEGADMRTVTDRQIEEFWQIKQPEWRK